MAAPTGPKKVHRYTVEFKIQVVRLSLHPQIQTQDVAQALHIPKPDGKTRPVGISTVLDRFQGYIPLRHTRFGTINI